MTSVLASELCPCFCVEPSSIRIKKVGTSCLAKSDPLCVLDFASEEKDALKQNWIGFTGIPVSLLAKVCVCVCVCVCMCALFC